MEKAPHKQGFLIYQIYINLHKAGFYDTIPALLFSSIPYPSAKCLNALASKR